MQRKGYSHNNLLKLNHIRNRKGRHTQQLEKFGSSDWTRTSDIRINSPPFYRLNYRGIVGTGRILSAVPLRCQRTKPTFCADCLASVQSAGFGVILVTNQPAAGSLASAANVPAGFDGKIRKSAGIPPGSAPPAGLVR